MYMILYYLQGNISVILFFPSLFSAFLIIFFPHHDITYHMFYFLSFFLLLLIGCIHFISLLVNATSYTNHFSMFLITDFYTQIPYNNLRDWQEQWIAQRSRLLSLFFFSTIMVVQVFVRGWWYPHVVVFAK